MTAAEQLDHHVLAEVSEDGMRGTISVAPNVLAEIIELASAGTEGSSDSWRPAVAAVDRFRSWKRIRRRPGVETGTRAAESASVWTTRPSMPISRSRSSTAPMFRCLAEELKRRISEAIDRMLGLKTGAIAVHVRAIAPSAGGSGGR